MNLTLLDLLEGTHELIRVGIDEVLLDHLLQLSLLRIYIIAEIRLVVSRVVVEVVDFDESNEDLQVSEVQGVVLVVELPNDSVVVDEKGEIQQDQQHQENTQHTKEFGLGRKVLLVQDDFLHRVLRDLDIQLFLIVEGV